MKAHEGISFKKPKPTKKDNECSAFMRALGRAHRMNVIKMLCGILNKEEDEKSLSRDEAETKRLAQAFERKTAEDLKRLKGQI